MNLAQIEDELALLDAEEAILNQRANLLDFAQAVNQEVPQRQDPSKPFVRYRVGIPHKRLAKELHKVAAGDIKRLIVGMPPQYGKSLISSVLFTCWYLGNHYKEGVRIAVVCYNGTQAKKVSRRCRLVMESPEYARVFEDASRMLGQGPTGRDAAEEWNVGKSSVVFTGIKAGGLTGSAVDLMIIDDPYADWAQAMSITIRRSVMDWWTSTGYTRLHPHSAVVIIHTRWHKQDLTGELLRLEKENENSEKWHKCTMPVEDKITGEPLDPDRHTREDIKIIKVMAGEKFSGLWMQDPRTPGGKLLDPENIVVHRDPASFPNVAYRRIWDIASTAKNYKDANDPDFTVGMLIAVTVERVKLDNGVIVDIPSVWVKDAKFCQEEKTARDELIIDTARNDGPSVEQWIEGFGGYKDAYTDLRDTLKGVSIVKKANMPGDKWLKASPLQPVLKAGNFHVLADPADLPPWYHHMIDQIAEFTGDGNYHDDFVDPLAIGLRLGTKSGGGFAGLN